MPTLPFTATSAGLVTADDSTWSRSLVQATWAFVALGVVLRLTRYLLCFPLWGDEAYLAINFPGRTYLGLVAPLDYGQVCPLLFLWIELAFVKLFGFSELTLRAFPCACGVASLFLFRHIAAKIVQGVPLLIAVAVFAVSYYPIRHASEVKPYASDLLIALLLLVVALKWLESRRGTALASDGGNPTKNHEHESINWLWILTAMVPFAVAISYPAVFVAGGISITVFLVLWKDSRRADWIPFLLYNVLLCGTFFGLLLVVASAQYNSSVSAAGTLSFWSENFPPLGQPLQLLVWLVLNHTGRFFGYPIGDDNGASSLTFICFAIGAYILWRSGERRVLVLFLSPFALNLLAAAVRRYPYGGSGRVAQHLVPMICLLAGIGAAALLARLRSDAARFKGVVAVSAALLLFGCGIFATDLVRPYKYLYDWQIRELARAIWLEKGRDAELVCLAEDLHEDFATKALAHTGPARALYVCNQQIYAPRMRKGLIAPRWEAISPQHPLRCVMFRIPETYNDQTEINEWLSRMQERYTWTGYEKQEMSCFYWHWRLSRYEIFEFTPKSTNPAEGEESKFQVSFDPGQAGSSALR